MPSDRITVTLTPTTHSEIEQLASATGLSKTDLINRAVTLLAFAYSEIDQGHELAVHRPATGETQVVKLL